MKNIINTCKSYFNAFQDLECKNSNSSKSLSTLKIISYFTLIAPLIMGMTYGIAKLVGRVKKCCRNVEKESCIQNAALQNVAFSALDFHKVGHDNQKKSMEGLFPSKMHDSIGDLLEHTESDTDSNEVEDHLTENQELLPSNTESFSEIIPGEDHSTDNFENIEFAIQKVHPPDENRNSPSFEIKQVFDQVNQEIAGTRTREEWIEEAKNLGLNCCTCYHADFDRRLKIESKILERVLRTFPVAETPKLNILSFASGDLLQDYLLLQTLAKKGYQGFSLDLVDPATDHNKFLSLKNLVKNKMGGVSVNINLYKTMQDLPPQAYDFAHGIDIDQIGDTARVEALWIDMANAFSKINNKGFFYLQDYNYELVYDFNLKPSLDQSKPYRIAFTSFMYQSNFFSFIFPRVLELKQKGITKIDIYFFEIFRTGIFNKRIYNRINDFLIKFNSSFNLNINIDLQKKSMNEEELMESRFDLFHITCEGKEFEHYLNCIPDCQLAEIYVDNSHKFELHKKHGGHLPNYYESLAKKYKIPLRVQTNGKIKNSIFNPQKSYSK